MMAAIIRYFGGKSRISKKLISLMPDCRTYVEPFGGGASVLLARKRSKLEVYNDLSEEMVTFFRVVRDRPGELAYQISSTPFSRAEFQAAEGTQGNDMEIARKVLIRSHCGFSSDSIFNTTGFRGVGVTSNSLPVAQWAKLPSVVVQTAERMRGVIIENRPAVEVMTAYDDEMALHYVDPPYVHGTRSSGGYKHEMNDEEHEQFLECLLRLKGSVLLSGYAHPMYDDTLTGWHRVEMDEIAGNRSPRTEVVWMNYSNDLPLFAATT